MVSSHVLLEWQSHSVEVSMADVDVEHHGAMFGSLLTGPEVYVVEAIVGQLPRADALANRYSMKCEGRARRVPLRFPARGLLVLVGR